MLLPVLVDGEPFEVNVTAGAELRFYGTGDVDGRLHIQLLHSAFHDTELDGDDAGHFDGAAKGDLTVSCNG
jgi:hypothetical protein